MRAFCTVLCLLSVVIFILGGPAGRRQDLNLLSLDAGGPGSVYRTNAKYDCDSYSISMNGRAAPFVLETVRSPFNRSDLANQTVLTVVGNYSRLGTLTWDDDVPAGERFVFRLMDSRGNVRYSTEKRSKEGSSGKKGCRSWSPTIWERSSAVITAVSFVAGVIAFVCVCAFPCTRLKRRWRNARAVEQRDPVVLVPIERGPAESYIDPIRVEHPPLAVPRAQPARGETLPDPPAPSTFAQIHRDTDGAPMARPPSYEEPGERGAKVR